MLVSPSERLVPLLTLSLLTMNEDKEEENSVLCHLMCSPFHLPVLLFESEGT